MKIAFFFTCWLASALHSTSTEVTLSKHSLQNRSPCGANWLSLLSHKMHPVTTGSKIQALFSQILVHCLQNTKLELFTLHFVPNCAFFCAFLQLPHLNLQKTSNRHIKILTIKLNNEKNSKRFLAENLPRWPGRGRNIGGQQESVNLPWFFYFHTNLSLNPTIQRGSFLS